jgi:hypothetical protein
MNERMALSSRVHSAISTGYIIERASDSAAETATDFAERQAQQQRATVRCRRGRIDAIERAQQRFRFAGRESIARAHHRVTRDLGEHAGEPLVVGGSTVARPLVEQAAEELRRIAMADTGRDRLDRERTSSYP